MQYLIALLPLLIILVFFVLTIKKRRFNKIMFLIAFVISVILNIGRISTANLLGSLVNTLLCSIALAMLLYIIFDIAQILVKNKIKIKQERELEYEQVRVQKWEQEQKLLHEQEGEQMQEKEPAQEPVQELIQEQEQK